MRRRNLPYAVVGLYGALALLVSCGGRPEAVQPPRTAPAPVSAPAVDIAVKPAVSSEPAITEYTSLSGTDERGARIQELLQEAEKGRSSSLLQLGMADQGQRDISAAIKSRITSDVVGTFPELAPIKDEVLAKLGDVTARRELETRLNGSDYQQQERAIDSLAYIGDAWAIALLRKGLDDPSGERLIFEGQAVNADGAQAMAPPVRFSYLKALNGLEPLADLSENEETWTNGDIARYKTWFDQRPRARHE